MPKILAATLMDEDWHVDPATGVLIYEFERPSKGGPYKMLHLAMDVRRNNPPVERRAPGSPCEEAETAYRNVVRQLFSTREKIVSLDTINQAELQADLNRIKVRRKLYYPDEEVE